MLDLVNRLHNTGVQVDIDLPQVAVIGSQSAGKSSLIESISGITLPRAQQSVDSRSSEPWKCIVSLCIYDDGKMKTEKFGDIITHKVDVEERIRRAQWAILNPKVRSAHGAQYFLTGDDHGANSELSFSSCFVSLQISGPDVADLSFCDLPGVLTKPDRIPTGEEQNWISILCNMKEPLVNGWYCVKQPSSAEIAAGTTWEKARKNEEDFFASTPVWSDLDGMYKKYLCTRNLVDRLSALLSDLISKRLPEIQDEIEKSVLTARDALQRLPKPPSSDPRNEIANLLHIFVRDLAKHVEGVPENGLLQVIRPAQDDFRRAIRTTAPDFQPFERRFSRKKKIDKAKFLLSEEGHEDFAILDETVDASSDNGSIDDQKISCSSNIVPNPDAIYIDEVMQRANDARTRELPGSYPFVVQESFIRAIIKKWRVPAQILCRTVYLMLGEHVQKLAQLHLGAFGQGQLAQRVKVLLHSHLNECMERAEERIDWLIKLEDRPFSLNTHYLTDYKEKFFAHYRAAREKDRNPKLMNAIQQYSPSPSSLIFKNSYAASPPVQTGIEKALAGLVEAGLVGLRPEDLARLIEPDGMEPALAIMADVRAYFQGTFGYWYRRYQDSMADFLLTLVAYKRFADNVPLAVDYELLWGVERNVLETLSRGLGIHGDHADRICKELAQEHATIAIRREELMKKLERMDLARQQLLQIGF
ncbi:hypothetical protein C0993_002309 [Termitomyces sp. T159_Od127]|nr:hypothetical protein C0993_002309 [Termitomyces sp. T159_Od127]